MGVLIQLSIPLFLLLLGFTVGRIAERRHFRSIHRREAQFLAIPATNWKIVDESHQYADAQMVIGSVVVSVDYFKRFLSAWRRIFGGELRAYAPLLDRARREALLRMKESYPGADAYLNCRIETSSAFTGKNNKAIGSVEVIASATAVKYKT